MEAAIQGLAAVVVTSYYGPSKSRGARGTAGSGSGARTLVDGLSLSVAHNHWLAVNHLDLHAALPLQLPVGEVGGVRDDRGVSGVSGLDTEAEEIDRRIHPRGFEAPNLDASKVFSALSGSLRFVTMCSFSSVASLASRSLSCNFRVTHRSWQ